MNFTEEEILTQLHNKDSCGNAFNKVVRAYQEQLYWHIRKMVLTHDDANDLLQNTFLKAWKNLDSFRGDSKLRTWLYTIATNETLTFLTQQKKRDTESLSAHEDYLIQQLESDSFFDGNAAELELQKAILQLPEKQRIVFNMKYFDNMKYEDMELILGTSVGALKASYHHAVKKIEAMILKIQQ